MLANPFENEFLTKLLKRSEPTVRCSLTNEKGAATDPPFSFLAPSVFTTVAQTHHVGRTAA